MPKLLSSLLAFLFFGISTAEALDFGEISALLDRQNRRKLTLRIEIPNTVPSDHQALGVTTQDETTVLQALVNHLNICVGTEEENPPTACDYLNRPVRWNLDRRPTVQDPNQVALNEVITASDVTITPVPTDVTNTAYNYVLNVTIVNNARDYTTGTDGTQVFLRLFPDDQNTSLRKDKTVAATIGSGVKDEVSLKGISSTKGTVVLFVDRPTSVTFENGETGSPGGVQALLVPNVGVQDISIPTKEYVVDPIADPTETDHECSVSSADGTTCSITCQRPDGPYTLDLDGTLPDGAQKKSIDNLTETQAISFTDLTLDESPYAIIYSYLPEGTGIGCSLASPTDAVTLLQLATGKEPKEGDPSCFIATAAYGSALDSHIRSLRWFRDSYLLTNDFGRSFVKAYYRHSPPLAQWIAERPTMRAIVRGALWLPVMLIELWRDRPGLLLLALFLPLPLIMLIGRRKTA